MELSSVMPALLVVVFFIVVALIVVSMARFGGFKGAIFGAKIDRTLGEVSGVGSLLKGILRVHALDSPSPGKQVGVELVIKGPGSWEMQGVALSLQQAGELARLLEQAIERRETAGRVPRVTVS